MSDHTTPDRQDSRHPGPAAGGAVPNTPRPHWLRSVPRPAERAREAFITACLATPVVGTAHLYPARRLTTDEAHADLLQQVVDQKLSELLGQSPPHDILLIELQEQLCGPEPFAAAELRRFLRAEGRAIQHRLEQSVSRQPHWPRDASSSQQSTPPIGAAHYVTPQNAAESIAATLSFHSAEIAPDRTAAHLRELRAIIDADAANADIYLLYYFAACTEPEIADILGRSESDVENTISLADYHLSTTCGSL